MNRWLARMLGLERETIAKNPFADTEPYAVIDASGAWPENTRTVELRRNEHGTSMRICSGGYCLIQADYTNETAARIGAALLMGEQP